MQDRSLYEDTSSPTASTSSVFIVAAIAAKEKRKVKTLDISGAYLNADMSQQEVLMVLDSMLTSILCSLDPTYKKFVRSDGTSSEAKESFVRLH